VADDDQISSNGEGGDRAQRFRDDLTKMHLPGSSTSHERNLARLGVVLFVLGPAWVAVSYFISHAANSQLQQNDAIIGAVLGVSLTMVGVALFLRYSLARFLRFWLARLSYEQHHHTEQVVDALGARPTSPAERAPSAG
jgi:hypothetical protein